MALGVCHGIARSAARIAPWAAIAVVIAIAPLGLAVFRGDVPSENVWGRVRPDIHGEHAHAESSTRWTVIVWRLGLFTHVNSRAVPLPDTRRARVGGMVDVNDLPPGAMLRGILPSASEDDPRNYSIHEQFVGWPRQWVRWAWVEQPQGRGFRQLASQPKVMGVVLPANIVWTETPVVFASAAGLAIVASGLWTLLRRSARRIRGRCVRCGYDLRGSDSRICPECGHSRRGTPSANHRRERCHASGTQRPEGAQERSHG